MAYLGSLSLPKCGALTGLLPGIVLVAVITASAYGLRHLPLLSSLSPMITAIFVGMLFANTVGFSESANAGIAIAGKRLLRLAVALLGLQLTFAQLAGVGVTGLALASGVVLSTLAFSVWMGRLLGVEGKLSMLLGAGCAICGASAIGGANAVTRAKDEDVSYAVACITLLGTVAMFLYPFLQSALSLETQAYGMWIGLSVHEVAQVVGAGFQGGEDAGQAAVVTKLARVMTLAPVVVGLAFHMARLERGHADHGGATQIVPFFVVGFLFLVMLNSSGFLPEQIRAQTVSSTPVLLTAAMAALGLGTSFTNLKRRGFRPLLLSALATIFIATLALLLVKFAR